MISDRDERWLEQLYPQLRRFAAAVHPAGVDPDDLLQDAVVRVLARGGIDRLAAPVPYLKRTILNLAANQHRRAARQRRALALLGGGTAALDRYPSDLAELMRLPPRARAVLYLSAVECLTYAETAVIVGSTEGAVRMAASRARRQLAAGLLGEA